MRLPVHVTPHAVVIDQALDTTGRHPGLRDARAHGDSAAVDPWNALRSSARRLEQRLADEADGRRSDPLTLDEQRDAERFLKDLNRLGQGDRQGRDKFLSQHPYLALALSEPERASGGAADVGLYAGHGLGIPNDDGWA